MTAAHAGHSVAHFNKTTAMTIFRPGAEHAALDDFPDAHRRLLTLGVGLFPILPLLPGCGGGPVSEAGTPLLGGADEFPDYHVPSALRALGVPLPEPLVVAEHTNLYKCRLLDREFRKLKPALKASNPASLASVVMDDIRDPWQVLAMHMWEQRPVTLPTEAPQIAYLTLPTAAFKAVRKLGATAPETHRFFLLLLADGIVGCHGVKFNQQTR